MLDRNKFQTVLELENALSVFLEYGDEKYLFEVQEKLNRFFTDSECKAIIYTKNIDRLFFGMAVYAVLDRNDINNIVNSSRDVKIKEYYIEIDSKLINELDINSKELTAILLHEVGHLVNDQKPIKKFRIVLDEYLRDNDTNIKYKDFSSLIDLFSYAVNDTMRKTYSIFTRNNKEIMADKFVVDCGYGPHLKTALQKVNKKSYYLNRGSNKFIVLATVLRTYKNIGIERLSALELLNNAYDISPSSLEKANIKRASDSINNWKDIGESYIPVTEEMSFIKRIQTHGMRSIESDVYEYEMRIRNVESEDDALLILRQVNMRLGTIEDYINNSNLNEVESARYYKLFEKYLKLREELSKKTTYFKKNYGVWYDYNYDLP